MKSLQRIARVITDSLRNLLQAWRVIASFVGLSVIAGILYPEQLRGLVGAHPWQSLLVLFMLALFLNSYLLLGKMDLLTGIEFRSLEVTSAHYLRGVNDVKTGISVLCKYKAVSHIDKRATHPMPDVELRSNGALTAVTISKQRVVGRPEGSEDPSLRTSTTYNQPATFIFPDDITSFEMSFVVEHPSMEEIAYNPLEIQLTVVSTKTEPVFLSAPLEVEWPICPWPRK